MCVSSAPKGSQKKGGRSREVQNGRLKDDRREMMLQNGNSGEVRLLAGDGPFGQRQKISQEGSETV